MQDVIEVYGVPLVVLDNTPDYAIAHPDEPVPHDEKCTQCVLAARPDTGEIVLLWLCGGLCGGYDNANWSLSKETPDYHRHFDELTKLGGYVA